MYTIGNKNTRRGTSSLDIISTRYSGKPFHLAVNALALWAVWRRSSLIFPTGTQLYIFFMSGIVSGWVGAVHQFDSVSVGSSGAVVGLLGCIVGWSLSRSYVKGAVRKNVSLFPAQMLAIVLVASILLPGMDAYANIGGAATGFVLGLFVSSKSEQEHHVVTTLVLVGTTVVVLFAGILFSRPSEETMARVQREQVAERAMAYIEHADRNVEEAMLALWGPASGPPVPSLGSSKAQLASTKKEQDIWRQAWHVRVVVPLERNAAMADSLLVEKGDRYEQQLHLLGKYTQVRLQEAVVLEKSTTAAALVGKPGADLRARIMELSTQLQHAANTLETN